MKDVQNQWDIMVDGLCTDVERQRLSRCQISECRRKSTLDEGGVSGKGVQGVGGGRYGTIKWGDSVDSGLYESGTSMLSLGLDEIIQRVDRD